MKSQAPSTLVRCIGVVNVDSVQVSLHPRGVQANEGCSTEQSTLVSALKFSHAQSSRASDLEGFVRCLSEMPGYPWPFWLKPRSVTRSVAIVHRSFQAKGLGFVHASIIHVLDNQLNAKWSQTLKWSLESGSTRASSCGADFWCCWR